MDKILLVGESWISNASHFKGWDSFQSATYHVGADYLLNLFAKDKKFNIEHMPSHQASEKFPSELNLLNEYSSIIFSDIGSNTILLHPNVWIKGETFPNRLDLVKKYVENGGSFLMIGGYLSFQGINGTARYHNTAIEDILPVNILKYDDRIEIPQGFSIKVDNDNHELLTNLKGRWPALLGLNELIAKKESNVILSIPDSLGKHPLLVEGKYGLGKTLVWASDIGPHWISKDFMEWEGYKQLWENIFMWLRSK